MATRTIVTCDHCGKEIPDGKGALEVRLSQDNLKDESKVLRWSVTAEFNFHEGCAQRVIEFWDDLNAGRVEARG